VQAVFEATTPLAAGRTRLWQGTPGCQPQILTAEACGKNEP
jgi:hypothetical protein